MQCIEWLIHNTAQSKPRGGRLWLMADPHSVNLFSAKECTAGSPDRLSQPDSSSSSSFFFFFLELGTLFLSVVHNHCHIWYCIT